MKRKNSALFTLSFIFLCGNQLFAQSDCAPICCPEIEDCCACTICPPTYIITPNAGPCVECSQNVNITADFLWWTAREDGTAFAMTSGFNIESGTTPPSSPRGSVLEQNTKWKPGFKVGARVDFCHDGWDLYAEYTWFRSDSGTRTVNKNASMNPISALSNGPETGIIIYDNIWAVNRAPQFMNGHIGYTFAPFTPSDSTVVVQVPIFQTVQSQWQLHFNVIDLALRRNFYISPRLTLRPHFGLKGTWQKQKLNVLLTNADLTEGVIVIPEPSDTAVMKNRFSNWGIGARAGVDTAWHFYRLFSLIGDVAITGLWEHFSAKRLDYSAFTKNSSSTVNLDHHFYSFAPVMEWTLGLRYEWWSSQAAYHIALDAGWESQYWLFQNKFIRTYFDASNNGTLGLQGLTLKAELDF